MQSEEQKNLLTIIFNFKSGKNHKKMKYIIII